MKNYEDKIYSLGETVTGQTQAMSQAVQKTLENNGGVGIMTGSYDQNLSILSVNNLLLHSTGYTFDTFMEQTKGSLRNFFYDEEDILERDRFLQLHGTGEAQILAADGTVKNVRLCKEDATDEAGRQIWVMSVQVNWDHVNLALLNEAIYSGFWYFDCDENSEIVNANWSHEFRKMLGYHDTLDFPNKLESWSDLLHPQDKERVMVQLQAAIKDKTNQIKYQVEYRMRMKDNQYQWFRASAEVIRRLDGSASRIAGIFINIDAEKKEIMQAQKSAAFHRAFTKADLCEYYVNLEANTFDTFKVEPSLMTVFEQSHTWDELIRHFVDSYVVETDKKAVSSFYDRGYIAERLKGLETELALECRITLNGEERWVRNVVIRGEIEDSEYAMIFLRDITEAKVESARHLQMAADNASMEQLIQSIVRLVDRFVVCDLENDRYEFYNLNGQMIYKPLGFYHDFQMQVLEKYKTLEPLEAIDILIAPDNIRKKLKSENDIYKFEYCSLDEKTYKIASYIPLEWKNGKLEKVLLASMDVTQEKKAEIESRQALKEAYRSAENANRAKTEFLSNMSHDIRTPMNAIVGLTAIAGANVESQDRVIECLGKITESSRHLLGLINEVLDMARIESGKMTLAQEDFNLSELVDNLITLTKPVLDEHKHNFDIHINHIEHEAVCGDSLRIQQVFVNLMSNAIKYTPDGGNIIFSIEEKPNGFSELGCYEFTIEDNGIGMSPEFQKIMFDPFSRADDHRTTRVRGTGLGMTITKSLVDMIGGRIDVQSEPGKGSRFTVTLKFKADENECSEINGMLMIGRDDDVTVSAKAHGVTPETVCSIGAAAELLSRGAYDVVLITSGICENISSDDISRLRGASEKPVKIAGICSDTLAQRFQETLDCAIVVPFFWGKLENGLADENEKEKAESGSALSGVRFLCAEDNEMNAVILEANLKWRGASCRIFPDGKSLVDYFAAADPGEYDMILMDVQMPLMNGYEAARAIRKSSNPDGKAIPIIAMTANAFSDDIRACLNAGMDAHISKPVDMSAFEKTVRSLREDKKRLVQRCKSDRSTYADSFA